MVVLVKREWAEDYADWLEAKCRREGFLPIKTEENNQNNREIRVIAPGTLIASKSIGTDWQPFSLQVRQIPYARFQITSNPPGAEIIFDGRLVGRTPWSEAVPPGYSNFSVGLEGYKTHLGTVELTDRENESLFIELKTDQSVRFGQPWTNSLGMKFVPLGEDLMVGAHEVRVKDFTKFAEATDFEMEAPKFEQGDDHPVVNITRDEASLFARWITELEKGDLLRIKELNQYRLPTDEEWSRMVGLEEDGSSPAERDSAAENEAIYPWGEGTWPPPFRSGNYAAENISNYQDDFPFTAPVGSFGAVEGIYDLGGNVFEWVLDNYQEESEVELAVARGGSWESDDPAHLALRHRDAQPVNTRLSSRGFRVVLVKLAEPPSKEEEISLEDAINPELIDNTNQREE